MKTRLCRRTACKQCRHDLQYEKADRRQAEKLMRQAVDTIDRLVFERRAAHNAALAAQDQVAKLERRIRRMKA